MKAALKKYAKRYDVLFSLGGMLIGSAVVYAKDWPIWLLVGVVVAREVFGYMAMLANERDEQAS